MQTRGFMAAPINRTNVLHEIANAVMGFKDLRSQFNNKSPSDQNEVIKRTLSVTSSGGYLGWMLSPLGAWSYPVIGALALSHFSRQDLKQPAQGFSLFHELDKIADKTWEATQLFLKIADVDEQRILAAKVVAVATGIGFGGYLAGLSPFYLVAASLPFALIHFTQFPKLAEQGPKEETISCNQSESQPVQNEQPSPKVEGSKALPILDADGDYFQDSVELIETEMEVPLEKFSSD